MASLVVGSVRRGPAVDRGDRGDRSWGDRPARDRGDRPFRDKPFKKSGFNADKKFKKPRHKG